MNGREIEQAKEKKDIEEKERGCGTENRRSKDDEKKGRRAREGKRKGERHEERRGQRRGRRKERRSGEERRQEERKEEEKGKRTGGGNQLTNLGG